MADVALVQCPLWGRLCPPAGLAQLAGALRRHGKTCAVFDLNNDFFHAVGPQEQQLWDAGGVRLGTRGRAAKNTARFASTHRKLIDAAVARILDTGARIVGFSTFESSAGLSLFLARAIKKRDPARIVVFGGPETALEWQGQEIIVRPEVDAIVPGEGELIFLDFVEAVEKAGRLAACAGVWTKLDGALEKGPTKAQISDLDAIPFADYSDFDLGRYKEPAKLFTFLSRGCVNRCSFCNEYLYLPRFRTRTGRRVRDEMAHHLARHPGVELFELTDLLMNGRLPELLNLAEELIAKGPRVAWAGQAIVRPFMTRDVLRKMSAAGCRALVLGVETGSQSVVARMGKGFELHEADRMVGDAAEAGISVIANFMLGFPGETEEDFARTLAFVERNRASIAYANPSRPGTTIGRGTRLYERAEEYGVVLAKDEPHAWRSRDGGNTPEIRQRRYETFAARCAELGVSLLPSDRANLRIAR